VAKSTLIGLGWGEERRTANTANAVPPSPSTTRASPMLTCGGSLASVTTPTPVRFVKYRWWPPAPSARELSSTEGYGRVADASAGREVTPGQEPVVRSRTT